MEKFGTELRVLHDYFHVQREFKTRRARGLLILLG